MNEMATLEKTTNQIKSNKEIRLLGIIAGLRGFGLLMISSFLSLFLHNSMQIGYALIGTLVLLYGLPAMLLSPLVGSFSDRFGRKLVLNLSFLGETLAFVFLAYSMVIKSLILISLAATLTLFFDFATGPPNSAYIADISEGSERTKMYTIIRVYYNAGVAIGVGSGGILIGIIGFPAVTLLCAILIGSAFILIILLLPPSPYDVLHSSIKSSVKTNLQPNFNLMSKLHNFSHSFKVLFTDMIFLEVCVAFTLASLVAGQWGVTFQLFANAKLGLPYTIIGFGVATNAVIVVLGQRFMTNSALNQRHTSIAIAGLVSYCIAFILIGLSAEWLFYPIALFFVSTIISTIGENLVSIPQTTLPSNLAPVKEIGNYNGIFQSVMSIGWLVSSFIGGFVLEYIPDPLLIWIILISPALPAFILLHRASTKIPSDLNRA